MALGSLIRRQLRPFPRTVLSRWYSTSAGADERYFCVVGSGPAGLYTADRVSGWTMGSCTPHGMEIIMSFFVEWQSSIALYVDACCSRAMRGGWFSLNVTVHRVSRLPPLLKARHTSRPGPILIPFSLGPDSAQVWRRSPRGRGRCPAHALRPGPVRGRPRSPGHQGTLWGWQPGEAAEHSLQRAQPGGLSRCVRSSPLRAAYRVFLLDRCAT